MSFYKILIANRGEIACRVLKTARELGYRTVAVFSDADRHAQHVQLADEAVHLGASEVHASYLHSAALLAAARRSGAEAIHPGYGFLSENADFARACQEAGLTFIGPDVEAIELMGSKRLSKLAMLAAGVPCIPGYEGERQDDASLLAAAAGIGYPIMVKASAGGGGRGMRRIDSADQLLEGLHTARSEAMHAFGSDELILEKALIRPRHVEIQVFADRHGHVIHLGERDCSIQRRHQKVVEESPCPVMTPELRTAMGEAAVRAARSCQYVGAGTVEFLLDSDGHFYFLEMNTRLQVEHPVTEMVTGLDLVAWQIKVAAGDPLPLTQAQVQLRGHAMEVRLYAEDPAQGFLPQTGPILHWQEVAGPHVRIDHGLLEGGEVSPYYDPMLAKIITWGEDRHQAARRLRHALEDLRLLGVVHNQGFLLDVLRHPAFLAGATHTGFIDEHLQQAASLQPVQATAEDLAVATLLFNPSASPAQASAWRQSWADPALQLLRCGEQEFRVTWQRSGQALFHLRCAEQEFQITVRRWHEHELEVLLDGQLLRYAYARAADVLYLHTAQGIVTLTSLSDARQQRRSSSESGQILAPMDGAIRALMVADGDQVQAGQTLMLLEAMKIEHPIKASCAGRLQGIDLKIGQQVKKRQVLAHIDALPAPSAKAD